MKKFFIFLTGAIIPRLRGEGKFFKEKLMIRKLFCLLCLLGFASNCFAIKGLIITPSGPSFNLNFKELHYAPWGITSAQGVSLLRHTYCNPYNTSICNSTSSLLDVLVKDINLEKYKNPYSRDFLCIGGQICDTDNIIQLVYPERTYLSQIKIWADDQVGNKTEAKLQLWDRRLEMTTDKLLQEVDVKKDGGWIYFNVNAYVHVLHIRSRHKDLAAGGDETRIKEIISY